MTTTVDRTYGGEGGVSLDTDRVVPWDQIVGVAEAADILTEKFGRPIERSMVSSWANRWRTNGFPLALPIKVARGLLWDRREVEAWEGPPGRWAHRDDTETDPADTDPSIPQ